MTPKSQDKGGARLGRPHLGPSSGDAVDQEGREGQEGISQGRPERQRSEIRTYSSTKHELRNQHTHHQHPTRTQQTTHHTRVPILQVKGKLAVRELSLFEEVRTLHQL